MNLVVCVGETRNIVILPALQLDMYWIRNCDRVHVDMVSKLAWQEEKVQWRHGILRTLGLTFRTDLITMGYQFSYKISVLTTSPHVYSPLSSIQIGGNFTL